MENISVSVRIRPLNSKEDKEVFAWKVDGNSVVQLDSTGKDVDRTRDTKYELDHIFGPDWTTEKIYEVTTQPLISKIVNGFNSTVFAYGQTSSGKTHTMRGTAECPGIIPLAVEEAFKLIEMNETREYLIRVSYMEIYNEDVNDLLAPENTKLPIHESKENGPYVCGLREDIVTTPEQVLELLAAGEANRHTGSTKMNEKSSRSHTIFRMVVESRAVDAESDDAGAVLVSALSLVDLAGSERVAKTGAEGTRMREGVSINKSLLTLGNVIEKLSDGALAKGSHIPYRDSKLTRILQPSLGGNAKTAIICAMTPAWCHREESHITLRFACRAKRVVNNAIVNEVLSDAAVLKRQAKEIEELKKKLATGGGVAFNDDQINGLRAQLLRSEQEKELMRIKLQEEQQEKEKARQDAERAQKEAANTKKLLFQSRDEPTEGLSRKNNRRETWCPGKCAWAMPAEPPSCDTPTHSGGVESSQRKRAFARADGAGPCKSNGDLGTLIEEDEEEDEDVAEGPTPQRRRREYSSVSEYMQGEDAEEEDGDFDLRRSLERIMASLPAQDRLALSQYIQQQQAAEERVQTLELDLERERLAAEEARNDKSAIDALSQQLEHAKWLARQSEKKADDLQAMCRSAEQERDALSVSRAELESAMEAKFNDLNARSKELADKYAGSKEQAQGLKTELLDARAKLEKRDYEFSKLEAKEAENKAKVDEAEAKLKQMMEELDGMKAATQAAEERAEEAEKRGRTLYDEVQRLEQHVKDLESRKRAPLYQKKQEEELKAAVEKAQECEARALEAELRSKELRGTVEGLQKELADLQETTSAAARMASQTQQDLIERHALELQRLAAESTLQQEHHDEAMATLRAHISELEAVKASLDEQLRGKDQQLATLQEGAASLQARIRELETQEAELHACAIAAQEKIAHLEQTAESDAAAHEAALAAVEQRHKDALAEREAAHQEALSSANAQHHKATALLEGNLAESKASFAQLEEELRAARERAELLVKASLEQSQAAAATEGQLQRQVTELSAKVQEAAGALKAKEELKEERQRSKQEIAALKSELQKLQLESKSGAKGKDMAQKEIDGLKKRLTDTEAKLRAAMQDKTAALQEKGNLERQLKVFQGQKLTLEKSLEKKDAVESKKRESMMVKNKEQLNTVEERLNRTIVENQKLHMDLTAKQCECSGLEEQLNEAQTQVDRLMAEVERLEGQCEEAQGKLQVTESELEQARSACEARSADLAQLQARLSAALECEQRHSVVIADMRSQYDALRNDNGVLKAAADTAEDAARQASQECAVLQAAAAKSAEEKSILESALTAAQEALAAVQTELANTAAAAAQAHGQWQSAQADLEATNFKLAQRETELAKLNADLAVVVDTEQRLRVSLAELRSQCDALVLENETSKAALVTEESARQAAQGMASEARDEVASLRKALAARDEEVHGLHSQLVDVEDSLATARADLSAAISAQASIQGKLRDESAAGEARLNGALAAAQQRVEALEAELVAVRSQLQDAQSLAASAAHQRAEALEAQSRVASAAQQRVAALEAELAAARAQLQDAKSLAASAVQQHSEVLGTQSLAASAAQQRVEALEAELATVRAQLQDAQSLADSAAQQRAEALEAQSRITSAAQQRVEALEAELATVRAQLQDAQSLAASAVQQHSEFLGTQSLAASAAQQRVEAELVAIRAQLQDAQSLAASAAHQHAEALEAQSRVASAAQQRVEALEAELAAARAQLQDAKSLAASAVQQNSEVLGTQSLVASAAQQRVEALEVELVAVRAQLQDAKSLAASVKTASDVTRSLSAGHRLLPVDELQRQLNELTATNQELEETVFSMTERQQDQHQEQTRLKSRIAELEADLAQRNQQVADLKRRRGELEEDLARARQLVGGTAPPAMAQAAEVPINGAENQLTLITLHAKLAELKAERDALTSRLADALAAQEELQCNVVQHVQHREQLLHDVDRLSIHLANRESDEEEQRRRLDEAVEAARQEAAVHVTELQGRIAKLQAAYDALQQERAATEQELAALKACQGGASKVVSGTSASGLQDVSAGVDADSLRAQVAELLQRQLELEAEMSDVQAARNVAVAEKMKLEQAMARRVLELETANICLQDELAKLQGSSSQQHSLPADMDTDPDPRTGTVCAERIALRGALAAAESSNAQLLSSQQELEAEIKSAQDRIVALQDALTAAKAAHTSAEAHAASQVQEAQGALSSLLLSYDQVQKDLDDRCAEVETLRVELARAASAGQQCVEALEAELVAVRAQLQQAQSLAPSTVQQRSEVLGTQSLAASAAQQRVEALEAELVTIRAQLSEAQQRSQALGALETEVQELLDANTLLESQLQQFRSTNAALQGQLALRAADTDHAAEAADLASRLAESERMRSNLERQVSELTQHVSAASAHQRAGARERASLEAELATVTQACRELREENAALRAELRAAEAAASIAQPSMEQLRELELQLQLQEDRHRLAMQKLQEELAALQKRMAAQQHEFSCAEEALAQRIQDLNAEVGKLQDYADELRMAAEQREAGLNAEKLSLESQIHWLREQLQQAETAPGATGTDPRVRALEDELRTAKRAEMKLAAMLFRIRKDVEAYNQGKLDMKQLLDARAAQYDIDRLTQKCQRLQRDRDEAKKELADLKLVNGAAGSKALQPSHNSTGGALLDKENLPHR